MTELITDNPLKQQVIQKTPEIGHFLNTPDILSLLQQAVKQLVQNILVGPDARTMWQSPGRNPDLGTKTLLQSPPIAGKPLMQPLQTFHQQIWHPEVPAAMPGPREMQVLAQIQQRLQALAMGEPGIPVQFLSPLAGSGHAAGSGGRALSSSGLREAAHSASAAPSQQFTVQQVLQALARQLELLRALGFPSNRANSSALLAARGDADATMNRLMGSQHSCHLT
uniref:UBA domain-containing protein n=1 Tax=Chelonoidis abingdonii TaxID=106734 RepID=A0A8C0GC91_CHEAB